MTTTVRGTVNTSAEAEAKLAAEMEETIKGLTSGVNVSGLKLNAFRGAKYFAVIADKDGNILRENDPDEPGVSYMCKLLGDSTWQFVDAIHAKLTAVPNAAKFMAWKWNDAEKQYVPSRTRVDKDGKKFGDEGAIEQYARRKSALKTVSVLPGVTEMAQLSKIASEIAATTRKEKGKVPHDASARITHAAVVCLKSIGVDKAKGLELLHKSWPELFAK